MGVDLYLRDLFITSIVNTYSFMAWLLMQWWKGKILCKFDMMVNQYHCPSSLLSDYEQPSEESHKDCTVLVWSFGNYILDVY